jgi:hypothetical protein
LELGVPETQNMGKRPRASGNIVTYVDRKRVKGK